MSPQNQKRRADVMRLAACIGAALLTYLALSGAAPPYPSESVLLMQEGYRGAPAVPDLAGAGLFAGLQEKSNLRMLKQLVFSAETLADLDHREHFVDYFGEHGNLYERWLSGQTDPSRRLELFEHVVELRVDDRANLLVMTVRAHEAAVAQRFARQIVEIAQRRINDLAQIAALDQMGFLEKEAKRLLEDDQKVQRDLIAFQDKTGLTAAEIGVAGAMSGGQGAGAAVGAGAVADPLLEWQQRLGDLTVRRDALKQFLRADSPDIQALDAEIAAVKGQIDQRRNDLLARRQGPAGKGGAASLGQARLEFAGLLSQAQLSHELYLGALRSIAQARADASRTLERVDLVQAPALPTERSRVGGWWNFLGSLAVGLLVWKLIGKTKRYVAAHKD